MRKSIQYDISILDAKIQVLSTREQNACYLSAKGKNHEDMFKLMIIRHELEDEKAEIIRKLNKPTLIKHIRKLVHK